MQDQRNDDDSDDKISESENPLQEEAVLPEPIV
jgi:hypothetical protein